MFPSTLPASTSFPCDFGIPPSEEAENISLSLGYGFSHMTCFGQGNTGRCTGKHLCDWRAPAYCLRHGRCYSPGPRGKVTDTWSRGVPVKPSGAGPLYRCASRPNAHCCGGLGLSVTQQQLTTTGLYFQLIRNERGSLRVQGRSRLFSVDAGRQLSWWAQFKGTWWHSSYGCLRQWSLGWKSVIGQATWFSKVHLSCQIRNRSVC